MQIASKPMYVDQDHSQVELFLIKFVAFLTFLICIMK